MASDAESQSKEGERLSALGERGVKSSSQGGQSESLDLGLEQLLRSQGTAASEMQDNGALKASSHEPAPAVDKRISSLLEKRLSFSETDPRSKNPGNLSEEQSLKSLHERQERIDVPTSVDPQKSVESQDLSGKDTVELFDNVTEALPTKSEDSSELHLEDQSSEQFQSSESEDGKDAKEKQSELLESLGDLVSAGRWQELSLRCESEFEAAGLEGIAARLWWIKCQLELGLVPVSILAAPLDSASASILSWDSGGLPNTSDTRAAQDFAAELLENVGVRLSRNGEDAMAVEFLNRASTVRETSKRSLIEVLEKAVSRLEELPAYQVKSFQADQLRHYKELRDSLGYLEKEALPSNSILDEKSRSNKTKSSSRSRAEVAGEIASDSGLRPRRFSISKPVVGVFAFLFVLGGAGLIASYFLPALGNYLSFSGSGNFAAEVLVDGGTRPQTLEPELRRIGNLGALEALWYDIENGGNVVPVSTENGNTLPAVSKISGGKTSDLKQKKPVVNTAGPIEPKEVREILAGRGGAEEEAARRVVDRDFVKGFPGGDGSKGFPVYRFPTPQTYRIIASTMVMSRPSYRGAELQKIRVGDRVKVEEDLGPWLKLSSREGRAGYILSQDAVLEPDKRR